MAGIPDLEEEAEAVIELSLGLSIGGSYRKNPPVSISAPDRSSSVRFLTVDWTGSDGREADLADPQRRREIHSRRRKREEKKSLCRSGVSVNSHDRLVMEAQGLRYRARDRTAREADTCRRKSQKDLGETIGFTTPNQTLYPIQNPNPNFGGHQVPDFSVMPPMSVPAHFPFHPMQCMPVPNGFHYPYSMPCCAPAPEEVSPASAGREGCLNPARQSFRPFSARSNDRNAGRPGGGDESGAGVGGGVFNRSPGSSLSAVSDNGSAGLMQGGSNSSDSRSRSTHSPSQTQPLGSPPLRNGQVQLEHSTSTQLKESAQTVEEATEKVESNSAQSCPTKTEPTSGTTDQPASNDTAESGLSKPIRTMRSASIMSPLPPKVGGDPLEDKNQKPPSVSLPHMPCVSTTGNGPNGKTITGFLYRYRKGEVISIVCVCHGSSFTPAEFVKHAGGTEISHPLRHIVVVPSAFG